MKTKYAKITVGRRGSEIRYTLRAGKLGRGQVLCRCGAWDNPYADAEACRILVTSAKRQGYTIVQEGE